jgi:hypothetical protein
MRRVFVKEATVAEFAMCGERQRGDTRITKVNLCPCFWSDSHAEERLDYRISVDRDRGCGFFLSAWCVGNGVVWRAIFES